MNYFCTGWHSKEYGFKTAIVAEGQRKLHICIIDGPVKVERRPLTEARHFTPIHFKGKPYNLRRACKLFRQSGRSLGITKTAKKLIQAAERSPA